MNAIVEVQINAVEVVNNWGMKELRKAFWWWMWLCEIYTCSWDSRGLQVGKHVSKVPSKDQWRIMIREGGKYI